MTSFALRLMPTQAKKKIVLERAQHLRSEQPDMREQPSGDLGKQIRALEKHIRALASVEYDEAQDRAVRIGRVLREPPLSCAVEALIAPINFDAFLQASVDSGGSFIGSSSYQWPNDDSEKLGMMLGLALHFADNPGELLEHGCGMFGETNFNRGIQKLYTNIYVPLGEEFRDHLLETSSPINETFIDVRVSASNRIFVVHGHDVGMRESVARFLEKIGLEVVILHEQHNKGATVIEKLEANSDVGFAVILMSADDVGRAEKVELLEPRPRQNVVLETGWFMGRYGRDRTMVLKAPSLPIPSDLAGLVYTEFDNGGGWKIELISELQAAGYEVAMP